jgi:hypothetical protein
MGALETLTSLLDLNTKANSYNLYGDFKYSSINAIEDYNGFKHL